MKKKELLKEKLSKQLSRQMIKYENEGMSPKEEARFFQNLVNTGLAWRLQGSYGRRAMELIESGVIMLGKKGHNDFYGNYVPSRYEVQQGTKGSSEYVKKMRKKLGEVM